MSELNDFNDLARAHGLGEVAAQLDAALARVNSVAPDDAGEAAEAHADSPAPLEGVSLDSVLRRFALLMPDGKIWDADKRQVIKKVAFKDFVGADVFKAWVNHPARRSVDRSVVAKLAPVQDAGGRGLVAVLQRYVYLNPSDMAWDRVERQLVPLKELKYAVADCFDDWLKHPSRAEIKKTHLVFDPTQRCDPATHINTFRGFAISPGKTDTKCLHIISALSRLCNDDYDVLLWLRRWLAYPLQNPGAKMATAVLVHSSVHGSGKSYIFDVVMSAIYGEYAKTVGQAQLEGNYNDWMSRTLYACYEEVLSRGQKYSHTGTLKQTITGTKVRLEKKFTSGWEEANHMNCVFLSNEILPLPVEPSDRRFLVIWPEKTLSPMMQVGIDAELKDGGAESFYYWLLQTPMQLDGEPEPFGPHTKPLLTAAKTKLIEHGLPTWEVFFNEWSAGRLQHQGETVPFCPVRVGDLFRVFDRWCLSNKEGGLGRHKFSSFISSKVRKRVDVDYVRHGKASVIEKGTFFFPFENPTDMTQREWLGGCVTHFERLLAEGLQNAN